MSGHPDTIGERLHPRYLIAEAFMRLDAFMPSPATLAKADEALRMLADEGWMIVARDAVPELGQAVAGAEEGT